MHDKTRKFFYKYKIKDRFFEEFTVIYLKKGKKTEFSAEINRKPLRDK